MASYLSFQGRGSECAGCTREIRRSLVGWTDDLDPEKLQPVCELFLDGLDSKLAAVQRIVDEAWQAMLDGI